VVGFADNCFADVAGDRGAACSGASWDAIQLFLHVLTATGRVGGQITLAVLVAVRRRAGAAVPAALQSSSGSVATRAPAWRQAANAGWLLGVLCAFLNCCPAALAGISGGISHHTAELRVLLRAVSPAVPGL
jgi:hypothetical protein